MTSALDRLEARTRARVAPPPRLTLSEWADRERVLAPESSAEPGRWRTARVPYLREPMDVIADRHVETVVLMASSQVGKTEVLLNQVGYHIHLDPCPMLLVEPTLDLADAISKDRIAPMLRDTPALRGRVAEPRARDGSNTTRHKAFPGGSLTLAGSNSPASLASRPIRVLLIDEADRIEASTKEGDPVALAVKRTTTYRRRKIIVVSSPTVKGASRIEDWWHLSDQRRLHVPCPACRARFVLKWAHVRFEQRDPQTAFLECPECHGRIDDHARAAIVAAGEWRAEAPFTGVAGFHIWEMYSPWRRLADQVAAFLTSRHSLEARQTWVNTSLGELWEIPGEKVEPSTLLLRRRTYAAEVPSGVRLLTCGVDTQDDRLEAQVLGWGAGEESWVIAYEVLDGDPERQDVWLRLDELLGRAWEHEAGGTMRIQCTLVDAAGHRTQSVYRAVIPRQVRRVYASFGRSGGEKGLLVSPPKAIRPASGLGVVQRRIVDVDQVKALIYGRLRIPAPDPEDAPTPEYVHLPASVGETYVDGLTAERLVTRRNKFGVPTKTWEQIRERNEPLDTMGLSLAALRVLAPNDAAFARIAQQVEAARLQTIAGAPKRPKSSRVPPPPAAPEDPSSASPLRARPSRTGRSRYLG